MPTTIDPGEKAAFIAIVAQVDPREAVRLEDLLVYYSDIPPIGIGRQADAFLSNNDYLTSAMAVFSDTKLVAAKIFNGKTGSEGLVNPVMIINSTYTGGVSVTVSSPPTQVPALSVLGSSSVDHITIHASVNVKNIIIGPGSSVGYIDSTASGALVNNVLVTFANNTKSSLGFMVYGSAFSGVIVAQGSSYGGVQNIPTGSCATPVQNLVADNVYHDSVRLTWLPPSLQSPPSTILSVNVYYRLLGSSTWIAADSTTGLANGDTGYTFTKLAGDTFYEFKVNVTCINGGVSSDVIVSAQTSCCA